MINKELLKKLCLAFGPSGNEDEVREIIIGEIKNKADDYYVDKVGNVIAFKKGAKTPEKKRLFAAHMDEVGFMVSSVDGDGYLKVKTVGGIENAVILGKKAVVGEKRLTAVFDGKPIHSLNATERMNERSLNNVYLDIGVRKKEEKKDEEKKQDEKNANAAQNSGANAKNGQNGKDDKEKKDEKKDEKKPVEIGEFAVFKSEYSEFGQNKVKSKAIDDRFGCYLLIEMIGSELEYDSWFAFTICEEIGLRGAATAANIIKAERAVIFEATTAGDIYDKKQKNKICSLGGGAVISVMDNSTVYNKDLVKLALETAESRNIKAQVKQAVAGGNDAGAIHKSGRGAEVLAVSLPTRYIHSPSCVADYGDMEECIRLALELEKVI
jgi:endoglucanase